MKLKWLSLILLSLFLNKTTFGQTTVSGTIMAAPLDEPLIGAVLFSPNTKEGTITDGEGYFELVTNDSIVLVSYLGYQTLEVKIDTSLLEVKMEPVLIQDPQTLISVQVVGTSNAHKIHPSVAHLNSRAIQINNEASIAPVLNNVPGVFMHSGALNTNRITIRGIGNRNLFGTAKIRAFLAGIPLTTGSGETNLEDIDLSIVDAVTVYKGPASSIYGAGLGGMINLEVSDNIYKNGNTFSINSTGGSYGLTNNSLNFTRAQYDKSIININVNSLQSDGYRKNNTYNRMGLAAFGKLKLNEQESISMLFNYVFLKAWIPSSLDSTDYTDNPEQAAAIWRLARGREFTEKTRAGVAYEASFGDHINQSTTIHSAFRNTDETRPFNILRENSIIKGARTEWIYDTQDFKFFSNFEFHLGGEIYDEDYNWQTYGTDGEGSRDAIISDNKENRYYSNLFTQLKAELNFQTAVTLGLNRNYTSYNFKDYYRQDGNQSSRREFPRTWSPFLNIGLDLEKWAGRPLAISATIAHGFSPPTLEETLQPNGAINPDIQSEQGWNYELGVKGALFDKFNYAISFYSMRIKDLLVARRTNFDEFIGINAGKTIHNGIEATFNYRFKIGKFRFDPFLNYTYSDYTFAEFIDDDNTYSGNELTGTAPHLVATGMHWTNNRFYGNLNYRFVDAMPIRDDNSIYSDAYQLFNLKIGYHYAFSEKWKINFFAGVNNTFNEKYASMHLINAGSFGGSAPRYYYPGLPRNYYVGMKVNIGE